MSDSYAKLFRSIAASTIVSEPLATRWLWVTMISQANKHGHVYASIPGLARIANITIQEVEAALTCFMSPDPYSRSSENEGRRIEEIDGGWLLLTHAKYAAVRSNEERAEYKRNWDRENRSGSRQKSYKSDKSDTNPTESDKSDKPDASDPNSTNTSSINKSTGQHAARFADFWSLYPNRKGKSDALKAWQRKKLDTIADTIIADVQARIEGDCDWKRGYVPHGSTYVNSERWQDDVRGDARHVSDHEALMAGVL